MVRDKQEVRTDCGFCCCISTWQTKPVSQLLCNRSFGVWVFGRKKRARQSSNRYLDGQRTREAGRFWPGRANGVLLEGS